MIKATMAAAAMSLMLISQAGANPISSQEGLNPALASETIQVRSDRGNNHMSRSRGHAVRSNFRARRGYRGYRGSGYYRGGYSAWNQYDDDSIGWGYGGRPCIEAGPFSVCP
jgi:hypothetical protein